MIKRTNSGVYMISTSRHPARLMALAVRRISASATLTAFMWEKAAGPIRRALEQFGDETANPPALPWPGALMRKLRFLGVGFLFMLFSQAFEDRYFTKREILSGYFDRSRRDQEGMPISRFVMRRPRNPRWPFSWCSGMTASR